MAAHTERPIIFPISNPTKLIEAHADDLIKWTEGRALVATGIPSDDVEYNGVTYKIGQANNALIYPGVCFGAMAASSKVLNEEMISQASHALGGMLILMNQVHQFYHQLISYKNLQQQLLKL